MEESNKSKDACVAKLKRVRADKKGSITKRIEQLNRLVSEGGSRTKISFLFDALKGKFEEVKITCEEIASLTDDEESAWFEEVQINFDMCSADVHDYLEARKAEPPSTAPSFTASW